MPILRITFAKLDRYPVTFQLSNMTLKFPISITHILKETFYIHIRPFLKHTVNIIMSFFYSSQHCIFLFGLDVVKLKVLGLNKNMSINVSFYLYLPSEGIYETKF